MPSFSAVSAAVIPRPINSAAVLCFGFNDILSSFKGNNSSLQFLDNLAEKWNHLRIGNVLKVFRKLAICGLLGIHQFRNVFCYFISKKTKVIGPVAVSGFIHGSPLKLYRV